MNRSSSQGRDSSLHFVLIKNRSKGNLINRGIFRSTTLQIHQADSDLSVGEGEKPSSHLMPEKLVWKNSFYLLNEKGTNNLWTTLVSAAMVISGAMPHPSQFCRVDSAGPGRKPTIA
jgi:hypothetical protein